MAGQAKAPKPVPREESVEQWLARTIATHGPMPEAKAQRLRRIIAADASNKRSIS